MRWLVENIGSPPLHSSSSPSSWLQCTTTSSPTFQRFTLAPIAPDDPGVHALGHVAERRNFADLVEILLRLIGCGMRPGRESDNAHGKASCDAAKLLLRPRDCNAQNTNRNGCSRVKTIKLPPPCESPTLHTLLSGGTFA